MLDNFFASKTLHVAAGLLSDMGCHRLAAEAYLYEWTHGARSASLALAIANARLLSGHPAVALVFFREVCRREPAHAEARAGMVCAFFGQGSVGEAAREAMALAAIDPCAETWVLVAALRKSLGDTVGSLDAFRQAARFDSKRARFLLGETVLGEENWLGLMALLAQLRNSRQEVGVGTHLVRSRSSLVARAFFSRRTTASLLVALIHWPAAALAQPPEVSATPVDQYRLEVIKALPTGGSLTARVVQLNAGLVLEREEGVGLFPGEPSRFTFRGGAWTQTRVEIDGFDVTDPILGGRALVWGSVDLGEVEVRTDAQGTVLVHNHAVAAGSNRARFLAQGNLGLFDSTGTTTDPIPSLARGHSLFDGVFAATGASSNGATHWSGAISGASVSRSERASDLERATARLGLEGRMNRLRGEDRIEGLMMYQGTRAPFGLTTAETRSSSLVLGAAWARRETRVRGSYLRGSTTDPEFGTPLPFERLVDGVPNLQVPHDSVGQRLQLEGAAPIRMFGDALHVSVAAGLSRATSSRDLTQPSFQALESLDSVSARQWSFSGTAPARLAQNRASLAVRFGRETSARTRLSGAVELQRLTVGDRDGEGILASTKVLPELRFEWRKSPETELYVEASIGTPPVPLVSYEAAATNAPAVVARLWSDLNRDGRVSAPELGAEVARRGPGSMTVDPDLSLPTMRRVIVGFKTRVGPFGIHATGFARRDRDLIETALDPQGSEIQSIRYVPDPSGDIDGPTDDQILPIVEENRRSFSASRFLLTNPAEHHALGEGAELGFETNSRHVHWGLNGAAFRVSGRGGNRGLRVSENDFGVVGETFDRTNADTFGDGRLFFDRAYSLRMYLTANDVRGFTFGALGRYDDGQPFARVVVQNDLPQGPDFVQAIPRGRARLHYTLSVDARLARRFKMSSANIEVSASVFNALGSQFEAEERVVWLPKADYRKITMVQPPRAFIIGIRIER
jgi:hypothetical protein